MKENVFPPIVLSSLEDEEEETEQTETLYVDKVLDHKTDRNKTTLFLVHWRGWGQKDNTWEPKENFQNTPIGPDSSTCALAVYMASNKYLS
jgi:hypothetical protein